MTQIPGSLLIGHLFDLFDGLAVLSIITIPAGVFTALIPWGSSLTGVCVLHALHSFFSNGIGTGKQHINNVLRMLVVCQALHIFFSYGMGSGIHIIFNVLYMLLVCHWYIGIQSVSYIGVCSPCLNIKYFCLDYVKFIHTHGKFSEIIIVQLIFHLQHWLLESWSFENGMSLCSMVQDGTEQCCGTGLVDTL